MRHPLLLPGQEGERHVTGQQRQAAGPAVIRPQLVLQQRHPAKTLRPDQCLPLG